MYPIPYSEFREALRLLPEDVVEVYVDVWGFLVFRRPDGTEWVLAEQKGHAKTFIRRGTAVIAESWR